MSNKYRVSAPEAITITLPIPPVAVRPNGRSHWRAKAKAVKVMKSHAGCEAISIATFNLRWKDMPCWTHARVRYDWYHPTKRLLDRDNIIGSCKAYLDGIVSAGVLADDNGVTLEPVGRFVDKDNPRVEITITPTETITPTGER